MSSDNFLGIYRTPDGAFLGRGCWSECNRFFCADCTHRIVFVAHSLRDAVRKAEGSCREEDYEYGYIFLNSNEEELENIIESLNQPDKKARRRTKFWICLVEGTNGGNHHEHRNLIYAEAEAERLAKLPANRGKRVYLLECKGICYVEASPVVWEIPR